MASTSVTEMSDEAMLAAVATALASDDVARLATLTRAATSLAVREACYKALDSFAKTHKSNELVSDDVMRKAFGALAHALCATPTSMNVLLAGLHALTSWLGETPHARTVAGAAGAVGAVVTAMRTNTADADLQGIGCTLLAAIFANTHQNVALAEDAEAVAAVLTALRGHPKCTEVQRSGCQALNTVIAGGSDINWHGAALANANVAVALGAVELEATKLIGADEELSVAACALLANLLFLGEGKARALRCDTFGNVLQAMRVYTTNVDVQRAGCLALARMGGHEAAVAMVTRLGAYAVIVRAMQVFPAHSGLQGFACFALATLLTNSPTLQDDATTAGAGAVLCLVNALQAHLDEATLQQYACEALNGLTKLPANAEEAWRVGAFSALRKSLETHLKRRDVAEPSLAALFRLVDSHAGRSKELSSTPAADCNAFLRAVVAAMRAYSDVFDIQQAGCVMMASTILLPHCDISYAVLEMGGFEVLVAALQTFIGKPRLAQHACLALARLAKRACTKLPRAVIAAAIDAVIAAMRAHANDAKVQEEAASALSWLCPELPCMIEQAIRCKAVELLCEALRAHKDNLGVELSAICALHALIGKVDAFDAGAAAAAGVIVAEVLLRPSLISTLATAACCTFASIACCAASNISFADAVAPLLHVMNRSAHDLDVSFESCKALLTVINISPQHAVEAFRRGAAAAVRDAARSHPGMEKLQRTASAIAVLLARVKKSASQETTTTTSTLQAREEAERRAEAMAAALIAEEETARAAQAPARSSKSGKKKRAGAGAGSAGSLDAAPPSGALPAAAHAASMLEKLSLDDEANDYSAPSAAAIRRRRRAAAKAVRRQSGAAASGGEDDEAKGADAAITAAAAPSTDAGADDGADAAATSLTAELRSPPAPASSTLPVSLPPLPTAPSQHTASASAVTPPATALKECCVCFADTPAAEQVALVPCGHRCMCDDCWRERLLPREPAARLCPICHAPVVAAMRIFDA